MNPKRFFLRCINFLICCCFFFFLIFFEFCIIAVIFTLLDPTNKHIYLACAIVFLSVVPAVLLTQILANYCRKKQLPMQADTATPVPEEKSEQNTTPEPKKQWDPANDIPDIAQKEYFSDTLFLDAVDVILESRIVSAGRLQSELKIGSNRAARILKEMEELGVIGPERGNRPREVFFTPEEWKTERKRFVWFPDFPDDPAIPPKAEGKKLETKNTSEIINNQQIPVFTIEQPKRRSGVHCTRCGSSNIAFNTVTEKKPAGCFTILLWIFLAMTVFGWLILIIIWLMPRRETVTYAICQDCGMRWRTM